MKVVFVYRYLTLGGVESVISARLQALAQAGIDAHAFFLSEAGGRPLFDGLEEKLHVGSLGELEDFLAAGVDIVTSIDTPEVFPLFAGESSRPPLVAEVHTTYPASLGYLGSLADAGVDRVFVPSEAQAELVRGRVRGEIDVRLVPNPLARDFVATLADAPQSPRPVLGWIGRLDEHKNWRRLLEVARNLPRDGSRPEIWMVGRPVDPGGGEMLHRRAREAGLLGRLRWLPGVSRRVIVRFLDQIRATDGVLLVTSEAESFGMTVAEGMARGCAVVVPERGPFDEFVEHDATGCLYRPGDAASAARVVAGLLADSRRAARLGRAARESVLRRYAPRVALRVLAEELREVRSVRKEKAEGEAPSA